MSSAIGKEDLAVFEFHMCSVNVRLINSHLTIQHVFIELSLGIPDIKIIGHFTYHLLGNDLTFTDCFINIVLFNCIKIERCYL